MKKLSDYQGEEALELWADLLDPVAKIIAGMQGISQKGDSVAMTAGRVIKAFPKEATQILLRIDPTPVNGLNILTRMIAILSDLSSLDGVSDFFELQGQMMDAGSSGSVMENTEDGER